MSDETDADLIARYHSVKASFDAAIKKRDRMKLPGSRNRQSCWCGSLNFTLMQIRDEIQERGLVV